MTRLLLVCCVLFAPLAVFADDCGFGSCRCYGPNCDTGGGPTPPERPPRVEEPLYQDDYDAGVAALAKKNYRKALKKLETARNLAIYEKRSLANIGRYLDITRRKGKAHYLERADDYLKRDKYGAALKQIKYAAEFAKDPLKDRVCSVYAAWANDALRADKISRAERAAKRARKKAPYCMKYSAKLRDLASGAWRVNAKAKKRAAFEASIRGDIDAALRAGKTCAEAFAGRRKLAVQSCLKRAAEVAAKLDAVERSAVAVADFITGGDVRFEVSRDGFSRPVDAARPGARANKIVTGADGWAALPAALLTREPGRIVVGVNSAVAFLTDDKMFDLAVETVRGTIRWLHDAGARGKALAGRAARRRFKVSSDSACCGVRGTDFLYRAIGDTREVVVLDGAVDVAVSGTTVFNAGYRGTWTAGKDAVTSQYLGAERIKREYPIFSR